MAAVSENRKMMRSRRRAPPFVSRFSFTSWIDAQAQHGRDAGDEDPRFAIRSQSRPGCASGVRAVISDWPDR